MKEKFIEAVVLSNSKSDVCRRMEWPINGTYLRKVQTWIDDLGLDRSHFGYNTPRKYPIVHKECPVCGSEFETQEGHSKEKTTCSHACANTFFRSESNNPNWRPLNEKSETATGVYYRSLAMNHYPNKCTSCGWDKYSEVLHVHHVDHDRSNNDLSNLELLCPTCHEVHHFITSSGKWLKAPPQTVC